MRFGLCFKLKSFHKQVFNSKTFLEDGRGGGSLAGAKFYFDFVVKSWQAIVTKFQSLIENFSCHLKFNSTLYSVSCLICVKRDSYKSITNIIFKKNCDTFFFIKSILEWLNKIYANSWNDLGTLYKGSFWDWYH